MPRKPKPATPGERFAMKQFGYTLTYLRGLHPASAARYHARILDSQFRACFAAGMNYYHLTRHEPIRPEDQPKAAKIARRWRVKP